VNAFFKHGKKASPFAERASKNQRVFSLEKFNLWFGIVKKAQGRQEKERITKDVRYQGKMTLDRGEKNRDQGSFFITKNL
jgi:hypothetical protein